MSKLTADTIFKLSLKVLELTEELSILKAENEALKEQIASDKA